MGITKDVLINHFASRYLQEKHHKAVKKISEILDLPVNAFIGVNKQELDVLNEFKIKIIRDFAKQTPEQIQIIKKTRQVDETSIEMHYIASKLIQRSWQKRGEYCATDKKKICFIGLDDAGKSTLISLLNKEPFSKAIDQEPTIDVSHSNLSLENTETLIWDFAGQTEFRTQYIENPEDYFLKIDVVIFVIDIQNQERYEEALNYIGEILKTIQFLGEKPFVLFMLHKFDPELHQNSDLQIGLNYIKEELAKTIKPYSFHYEMIPSSIYSTFKHNPKVVTYMKDLFRNEKENPNLMLIDVMMKLTENLFIIGEKMLQGQQQIIAHIQDVKPPQLYRGDQENLRDETDVEFIKPSAILKAARAQTETSSVDSSDTNILDELKTMFSIIKDEIA